MTQTLPTPPAQIVTVDPSTGEPLATHQVMSDAELEAAVAECAAAAVVWSRTALQSRLDGLERLAKILEANKDSIAELITAEMGKPLREAVAEVDKSAATARWYAANALRILADRAIEVGTEATAWVAREPLGVVLAVMPWNFPLWQVMRAALPTLAAGNTMLLKHSPNVTGTALLIERLVLEACLPEGVLRTLVIDEDRVAEVTERLISDDRVAAVTLTGSNRAGAAVGAAAGRAMKPSLLELGGSDPFVVLDDADLDLAIPAAVRARFANAGQSCVCAKRFIVTTAVADTFIDRFVAAVAQLRIGDPRDEQTHIGPMARADLRDQIADQVQRSIAAGAELLLGGHVEPGPGNHYAPTLLLAKGPGIAVFDEETFGPVACISIATDDVDAARLAAATEFGLGISIWSRDQQRALAVAAQVTTGAVFVNAIVASDPRLPFGGTRRSGHGRELAEAGLTAFTNERSFWAASG